MRAAFKSTLIAPLLALGLAAQALAADMFSASTSAGYARLLFNLDPVGRATAGVNGAVLTITFDRKIGVTPSAIVQALPRYISSGRVDANGLTYRFALTQPVRLHSSASGKSIAVDLEPPGFEGAPPDLPPPPPAAPKAVDLSKLKPLKVRAGAYQNFTRIVFEWPRNVPYTVFPGAGKLTVRFDAEAKPDFSGFSAVAPPWVKAAGWHIESGGTIVEFSTDSASGFHDFREGSRIVLDILAPKTDAASYAPPDMGKPGATPIAPAKMAQGAGAVQAIAEAAAKLNGGPAQPAAPSTPAPPVPVPDPKQVDQPAAPLPETQMAGSTVLHDGVALTFPGAGRRGSAVFIRGLTAWVVLQDAPPLDAVKLKEQLGTFPEGVYASSSDGISILRLALKQPEEIAATAEGSILKVVIAPHVTSTAETINFSRNQDNPRHSSISTLLPSSTKIVRLVDPVAGDELIVIPGAAGRGLPSERAYVEFSALPSASGLVLAPFVDDLSVTVEATRVTITGPAGLSLTPPLMAVGTIPESLAKNDGGPCFLDYETWRRITGGSFLTSERRLRAAAARLEPEEANHARLKLAQFYLANGFAAEALGLINIIQTADPSLQSDMQLQTMRAAADYGMGRYHDAHNDLAAAQFDSDRHAALWRGLTEAALEDWTDAHTDLERAMPTLGKYPHEMQARVRLADAEAALGIGRVEIADAQLSRLPPALERRQQLEGALDRARLDAAENQKKEADRLFAAVESGGDEQLAAQAIYYRVVAGLKSGTMTADAGINALERLRFRWRGDALEMNTLRRLASLYFGQKKWRDGLRTLRTAAQNFPNSDMADKAQDDMRMAFVDLFLKGKADAMPPVQALALFYDFIDLTPIGADGDEMIRRMADRLVAVDLLGPAADLLQYQVTKRLDGVARAQVATRLAMIQLLDHKPETALLALRSTQISTLPDDVNHQRLLLEARALADEKQWDQALDLLGVDQSPDTLRLKSDIYWQSGNWAVAAQNAENSLGQRWSDSTPLNEQERQQVMRAAVAYSLANDETSLERLRDHFTRKMQGSPDAVAFGVITQRIDMHGMAFRDAAAQVASIDTLTAFMKDMEKRPVGQN